MLIAFVTEGASFIRETGFKSALSKQEDAGAKNKTLIVDTTSKDWKEQIYRESIEALLLF